MNLRLTCRKFNEILGDPDPEKSKLKVGQTKQRKTNSAVTRKSVKTKYFKFDNLYETREIITILKRNPGVKGLEWNYCLLDFKMLRDVAALCGETLKDLNFVNVRYKVDEKDHYVTLKELEKVTWKNSDPQVLQHLNVQLDTLSIEGNALKNYKDLQDFIITQVFLITLVIHGPVIKLLQENLINIWDVYLTTLSLSFDKEGTVKMDQNSWKSFSNVKKFLTVQKFLKNLEIINFPIDQELLEIVLGRMASLENLKLGNLFYCQKFEEGFCEKNSNIKNLTLMGLSTNEKKFSSHLLESLPNLTMLTLKDTDLNIHLALTLRKLKLHKLRIEKTFARSHHGYFFPSLKELEFRGKSGVTKKDNLNVIRCNPQIERLIITESYEFDMDFKTVLGSHKDLRPIIFTAKNEFDFLEEI